MENRHFLMVLLYDISYSCNLSHHLVSVSMTFSLFLDRLLTVAVADGFNEATGWEKQFFPVCFGTVKLFPSWNQGWSGTWMGPVGSGGKDKVSVLSQGFMRPVCLHCLSYIPAIATTC